MDQRLTTFIAQYLGMVGTGDTPENKGQCVGLIEVWTDSLGLTHTWGNANQLLDNADKNSFDVIFNDPNNLNQFPVPGDVLTFNWGKYGHTGIVVKANGSNFDLFEQNNPEGHAPQVLHHNDYSGVIGWLHPKAVQPQGTFVDAITFTRLVDESTKYENFQKAGYAIIDDVIARTNNLQTQIDNLNKEVGDKQSVINKLEAEVAKANADYSGIVAELQKIKSDDSEMGLRNIDVSHKLDTALSLLQLHYKQVNAVDEQTYEKAIQALQEPHDAVVKQVQPTIEALADAAILKKQPIQKPNPVVSWLKGFLHIQKGGK